MNKHLKVLINLLLHVILQVMKGDIMNNLFGMLFPTIISVYIYKYKQPKKNNYYNLLLIYLINTLFVNLANYFIIIFLLKKENFIFTNLFTFKYCILSIFICLFFNYTYFFLKNHIKFKIIPNE